ncbi:MAG: carboxypeptidase-like regulatory domain-containing protein [Aeromicrobium erythreum]
MGERGATYRDATTFTVTEGGTTEAAPFTFREGPVLSGTVRDATGRPVRKIDVAARRAGSDEISRAVTLGNGTYRFGGLTPGRYELVLTDGIGEYASRTVDDVRLADDTVQDVVLDRVPPEEDRTLLRGTVTGPTGVRLAGATVVAYAVDGPEEYVATTRRDGTYSVPVAPGAYRLFFSGVEDEDVHYVPEWHADAPTYARARTVTVGSSTVRVDATLARCGTITGKVTGPGGPLDLDVVLLDADGSEIDAVHGTTGTYRFVAVRPGTYRIRVTGQVRGSGGGPLVRQFHVGRSTFATATPIVVRDGATSTARTLTMSRRLSVVTAPRISGTPRHGRLLRGTGGTWSLVVDVERAYRWYRGTSRIAGATGPAYRTVAKDVGRRIHVCVVASHRFELYETSRPACSAPTAKVAGNRSDRPHGV